jgi:hypothetical protein
MIKFNVNEDVTSKLKFKPNPTLNNLCLGTLENVSVQYSDIEAVDNKGVKKDWEFSGMKIPRLVFEFKNVVADTDVDKAERTFIHSESVITITKNTGEKVEKKTVNDLYHAMWKRIKHIHDAYKDSPNFVAIKTLPEMIDDGTAQERAKNFDEFFTAIAAVFSNKEGKKIYQNAKEQGIITFMKLVALKDNKYLTFPTYVGEGFIEAYKEGVPPTIELKPSETVVIKSSDKENATNTKEAVNELPDFIKAKLQGQ